MVGVATIKSANRVATSAADQAKATREQSAVASAQLIKSAEQLALGREQLEKEREALELSIRPILVDVPAEDLRRARIVDTNDVIEVTVPVRNIGGGAAFVHEALFTTGVGNVDSAEVAQTVIPSGETTVINRRLPRAHPLFGQIHRVRPVEVAVAVKYEDIAGNQRMQSVVRVVCLPDDFGVVRSVEMYNCDDRWIREADPIVQTGAGTP